MRVKIHLKQTYQYWPIWNVIGKIRGSKYPDEWVVLGNHRDAWVYGAVDPNSGATYGFLPVWLKTNASHEVTRIIAPDFIYNEHFGYGTHARLYVYPSTDEQWSVSAGFMQRVERSFFGQFQRGRLRQTRWSTWISVDSMIR